MVGDQREERREILREERKEYAKYLADIAPAMAAAAEARALERAEEREAAKAWRVRRSDAFKRNRDNKGLAKAKFMAVAITHK